MHPPEPLPRRGPLSRLRASMIEQLRDKLADELAQVDWRDLRQHAARGALFIVSGDLGLLEATLGIARDDRAAVETWLQSGALARPTDAQLSAWESELDKPFEYLIAQPFVLARALPIADAQ